MNFLLYYLFIIWIFCSCTELSRLESALLQSGANRPELEKVLSHYEDEINISGIRLRLDSRLRII